MIVMIKYERCAISSTMYISFKHNNGVSKSTWRKNKDKFEFLFV